MHLRPEKDPGGVGAVSQQRWSTLCRVMESQSWLSKAEGQPWPSPRNGVSPRGGVRFLQLERCSMWWEFTRDVGFRENLHLREQVPEAAASLTEKGRTVRLLGFEVGLGEGVCDSLRHAVCFSVPPQQSHTHQLAAELARHVYTNPRSASGT